ncbi:MAG: hypothetical protein Q8N12_00560 [Thermodesulfovibrionales bacterium]|nr:hypothetical protein [Nitrospinota bacterium]MCG2813617.1 hypothetical protein [Thermodesulfovibrionales bacterium]MDP3047907.1 hypothetical protein [Thermodesulfovibrionales bacterium]
MFVVGLTLGIGKTLLGYYLSGSVYLSLSLIAGYLAYKRFSRHGWGEVYK